MLLPNGQSRPGILMEVLYVPSFQKNLFSSAKAAQFNVETLITKNQSVLRSSINRETLGYAILSDGLYILQCQQKLPSRQSLSTITKPNQFDSIDLWHQHLGHISEARLRLLAPTYGLHFQENAKLKFCLACALGKAKRALTSKGPIPLANQPLQLISTDIFGPFPPSIEGAHYYYTFVDSHS